MNVIGYLRVSTNEQAQSGLGLEAQQYAILDYAKKIGSEIIKIFTEDGLSGSLPISKRPALRKALNTIKKGDVLVVAKRDRLSRDVRVLMLIEDEIKKKKARIISTVGEGTESDNSSSILFRGMIDQFSQFERLRIGERTKDALHAKKLRRERIGHIPFGFKLDENCTQCSQEKEEHLVVDQQEQKIIQEMLRLKSDKLSVRKIADMLNKNLFLNRGELLWNHMSIHRVMKGIGSHKCLLI
jgi:DNA invertase Pin-like site-specific DNA recombinase